MRERVFLLKNVFLLLLFYAEYAKLGVYTFTEKISFLLSLSILKVKKERVNRETKTNVVVKWQLETKS